MRELADFRLVGASLADVVDLAQLCWDRSDNTGDARFCGVARALEIVTAEWDVKQGLETATVVGLDGVFANHISDILSAEDPASGAAMARWMREDIIDILRRDQL